MSALISEFIIRGLHKDVSVDILHKTLGLEKYPSQHGVKLSLVVDKKGNSKRFAFVMVPRSCSKQLLNNDGCKINGLPIKISPEEKSYRLMKERLWVKTYKHKGLIMTVSSRPQCVAHRYKSENRLTKLPAQKSDFDPLFDMFADLSHKRFSSDLDVIINGSFKNGIEALVIPMGCGKKSKDAMAKLREFDNLIDMYFITGIAPGQASDYKAIEKTELDKLRCLNGGRCMGPIGLDFRQENISTETKDQQIYAFEEQLKLACDKKKPLYLVEHNAHEKFVSILTKYEKRLPRCVIVNFTGTQEVLEKYISMGFYIAVYGHMTPSKCVLTRVLTKVLQDGKLPREQILLSSNAPKMPSSSTVNSVLYQTLPISELSINKLPEKSSRSEPLCVFATLEITAKHLGCYSTEEINALGKQIVENSKKFLGLHKNTSNVFNPIAKKIKDFKKFLIVCFLTAIIFVLLSEYMFGTESLYKSVFHWSLIKESFSERQSHSSFVQNVLFNKCSR